MLFQNSTPLLKGTQVGFELPSGVSLSLPDAEESRADQGERPSQPNRQTPLSVAPTLNSLVPSIMLGADGRLHDNVSTV